MRALGTTFLALGVVACASTSPAPVVMGPADRGAVSAPGPSVTAPPSLMALLRRAGNPDAPTLEALQQLIGPADVGRSDGAGAVVTYRTASCALALFFTADATGAYRLALVEPGRRAAFGPTPDLDLCTAELTGTPERPR